MGKIERSQSELNAVVETYRAGLSMRKTAMLYGFGHRAVRRLLDEAGVVVRSRGRLERVELDRGLVEFGEYRIT